MAIEPRSAAACRVKPKAAAGHAGASGKRARLWSCARQRASLWNREPAGRGRGLQVTDCDGTGCLAAVQALLARKGVKFDRKQPGNCSGLQGLTVAQVASLCNTLCFVLGR